MILGFQPDFANLMLGLAPYDINLGGPGLAGGRSTDCSSTFCGVSRNSIAKGSAFLRLRCLDPDKPIRVAFNLYWQRTL
jgi:hypothetical protein